MWLSFHVNMKTFLVKKYRSPPSLSVVSADFIMWLNHDWYNYSLLIGIEVDSIYCRKTKLSITAYASLWIYIPISPFFPFLDKFLRVEILIQKIFRKAVPIYILTTVYKNAQFSNKLHLCWQLSSFKIFTSCETKDDTLFNFYFFDY